MRATHHRPVAAPRRPRGAGRPARRRRARWADPDVGLVRQLAAARRSTAAGLAGAGVRPGDRVALLIPPGIDLTVALYACWRTGAVVVLVDAGLGPRGLSAAISGRGSRPRDRQRAGARRGAGPALAGSPDLGAAMRARRAADARGGRRPPGDAPCTGGRSPAPPTGADAAAVVVHLRRHRPAKGVVYPHSPARGAARRARRACTRSPRTTGWSPRSRRSPSTARRWASRRSSRPWTSPRPHAHRGRARRRRRRRRRDARVRLAGRAAPTWSRTAAALDRRAPRRARPGPAAAVGRRAGAAGVAARRPPSCSPTPSAHTPYGMTECLPVADHHPGRDRGGGRRRRRLRRPARRRRRRARSPRWTGSARRRRCADRREPGVLGEVVRPRRPRQGQGYDRLWLTEHAASHAAGVAPHRRRRPPRRRRPAVDRGATRARHHHRPRSASRPCGIEQRGRGVAGVAGAAVVGVGPRATQQVVGRVVEPDAADRRHRASRRSHGRRRGPRARRRRRRRRRARRAARCRSTSGTTPRSTAAASGRVGRARARRRARWAQAVKVLVTGASSLLGGAVAARWPPAATT